MQSPASYSPSEVPTVWIDDQTDPVAGQVRWSPTKSVWITSMYALALVGGWYTFSASAVLVFLLSSALTLCLGHSLGMHRRFIHQAYACPKWLEYWLVHFGVLVGLAGPIGMMRTHDLRDWAQRQADCHDYFAHRQGFWRDGFWQLHCEVELERPPKFVLPDAVRNDRVYRLMETTWMWQQLPWALALFALGGLPWVVWGIGVRVAVSTTGHWLIGYFAHNQGPRDWHVKGASVQGYNVPLAALITFGECWHNNHHAFPGSAKLGLKPSQLDPGWWLLKLLERAGLVWNLVTPEQLPRRPELRQHLGPGKSDWPATRTS